MKINLSVAKTKIEDLNNLYNRVVNIRERQSESFKNIIANVEMGNFNSQMKNFDYELDHQLRMMGSEIYNVTNFLNNQINQYAVIGDEATNKVNELISLIQSTYQKSANATSNGQVNYDSINAAKEFTGYSVNGG